MKKLKKNMSIHDIEPENVMRERKRNILFVLKLYPTSILNFTLKKFNCCIYFISIICNKYTFEK